MSEVIRPLKAIGGLTKERSFAERSLWRGEGLGYFGTNGRGFESHQGSVFGTAAVAQMRRALVMS